MNLIHFIVYICQSSNVLYKGKWTDWCEPWGWSRWESESSYIMVPICMRCSPTWQLLNEYPFCLTWIYFFIQTGLPGNIFASQDPAFGVIASPELVRLLSHGSIKCLHQCSGWLNNFVQLVSSNRSSRNCVLLLHIHIYRPIISPDFSHPIEEIYVKRVTLSWLMLCNSPYLPKSEMLERTNVP